MTFRKREFDTPVLRHPPFGNIQARENFHPGRDSGSERQWRIRDLMQHAVEPVADPQFPLIRFDMNVRGLLTNGIHQDLVDEAHHRGVDFSRLGAGRSRRFRRHILKTGILIEIRKF